MNPLQKERLKYQPLLPRVLQNLQQVSFVAGAATTPAGDDEIKKLFPITSAQAVLTMEIGVNKRLGKRLKVGVVFSGGQAPGGHNVIAGLLDALKSLNHGSSLWGFLGGPDGIIKNRVVEVTSELLSEFRNQGGFDLLGSGRTKIETDEQLKAALKTVTDLALDGLVIIGGDDSNTNAAVLAEYFLKEKCNTKVIGVPKTIDGDLKNEHVAVSFGFDTACKIYSEMIGNIERDALSAKKYTHFIKIMGRSASHIALECALRTHPNMALIGEELGEKQMSLSAITNQIADVIAKRAEQGKNYGVIIIPEGVIEFIPEMKALIAELNQALANEANPSEEIVLSKLKDQSRQLFNRLPKDIRIQLIAERDPHGNVQVSLIETEKLLIELVKNELKQREKSGTYKGKFSPVAHFLGYEGRSGFPSNFDCNYCYSLGYTAALLIDEGATGYMAYVEGLTHPPDKWTIGGLPIVMLLHLEERAGKQKPVIRKALVNTQSKTFKLFSDLRGRWLLEDDYQWPGPMQFAGDLALTDSIPMTLTLEA